MGFALPGSIGAKMAFPDKKVLSVNGDAGFLMNVQDLETAVRNKINIVAVVWLDGEYGLIKWKQQVQFKGEHSDLKFDNPNFLELAKSFQILKSTDRSGLLTSADFSIDWHNAEVAIIILNKSFFY